MIGVISKKELLAQLRGIIFPLKDNIRTLDDDVCVRTLNIIILICKKSDKITEELVKYYHLLLPNIDVLRNRHLKFGRVTAKPKPVARASRVSEVEDLDGNKKKVVKLIDLRRNPVDVGQLVQDTLEYFERHGGLFAYSTIKKMIPKYESCLFS
mmetsp:Transcript_998/g.1793  ORF Transcript_998/g.1793 Transcript_998/m.1793 type:complete len:154 (-) Transcript_998:3-464(-)